MPIRASRFTSIPRACTLGLALTAWLLAAACASPGPPQPEGRRPSGLRSYSVKGQTYHPIRDWQGYTEVGIASWYGRPHHGRKTANGERFDAFGAWTAAHKLLPFDVCVEVENLENGERVTVRINDRGPFAKGRVIDLSKRAADAIGVAATGVAPVRLQAVSRADASGRCETSAAPSFFGRLRGAFAAR
jgi:rare lipoprotein A